MTAVEKNQPAFKKMVVMYPELAKYVDLVRKYSKN